MKHPDLVKKEREVTFNRTRDRFWYRWMSLYTLGLASVLVLIYAVRSNSTGVMVSVVAGMVVVGVSITGWLAGQRALDEVGR